MKKILTNAKIVATIGPASRDYESIYNIIQAGARAIRHNFSHETAADHQRSVDWARKASKVLNIPVAIFQDLQGPESPGRKSCPTIN